MIGNKVGGGKGFVCPTYFSADAAPSLRHALPAERGDLVMIPAQFMPDLDDAFARLVGLVPFQFNTELKRRLAGRKSRRPSASSVIEMLGALGRFADSLGLSSSRGHNMQMQRARACINLFWVMRRRVADLRR